MNKSQLIAAMLEEQSLLHKGSAELAIDALTKVITKELKLGGQVSLIGFGTFSVSERAARTGRNPQTGAALEIAAAKVPKFKAGKALKDACNA